MIDLRQCADKLAGLSTDYLLTYTRYQPYILPDGTLTGAGYSQLTGDMTYSVNPEEQLMEKGIAFVQATRDYSRMYEDFIGGLKATIGSLSGLTHHDFACNSGYLCYRLLQEGAFASSGSDVYDFVPIFSAMNNALNVNATYVQASYDFMSHRPNVDLTPRDIVTCTAFMLHSSDPTFLLHYLASITRRYLMLVSLYPRNDDYVVSYSKATSVFLGGKFPMCFDGSTLMSDALLRYGLESLGFRTVVEITRRPYWILRHDDWRCFIAVRD
jgi:hypothetical protein